MLEKECPFQFWDSMSPDRVAERSESPLKVKSISNRTCSVAGAKSTYFSSMAFSNWPDIPWEEGTSSSTYSLRAFAFMANAVHADVGAVSVGGGLPGNPNAGEQRQILGRCGQKQ